MPPTPPIALRPVAVAEGIHQIPVLSDNIIWIWVRAGKAVVVDPAVGDPVIAWLEERDLDLDAVLQTHHHSDHIGGTPALINRWPDAEVIAAADDRDRIPLQTISVSGGDQVALLGQMVSVIDVPAHTRCHIAFVLPAGDESGGAAALFCGDTLFGGGCGRLFEGNADDMHRALRTLASLPEDTGVHCAHEYTEANLRWAAQLRPDDSAIKSRLEQVKALRSRGESSLPSSIALEKRTNLFLQAESAEELAELRRHKDQWRG